jgi:hypothetical protein
LAQPLGPPWRVHAKALNTMFMTLGENPIGWASAYLPMNAALRALVDQMGDAALTGPVLSAVGALALWKCARLLWPEDREAAIVAILLYALSGQILVAGMTAYAMPAHLTFNLVWLWLFLLDRRRYDLACLFVGLVATGLHQPLFHPLFVAPFLVLTLRDRRWSRLALFIGGYALICGFWLAWPHLTRHFLTDAPAAATGADFWARLAQVLAVGDASRWPNMAANLLRFVAWQPWLLTPLMALGFLRGAPRPWVFALAASVVLPALAMAILLPYQGHGFGYRYLHGVLGPAILLAAAGFCAPKDQREKLRFAFRWQALSTLCVVAPLQFWFAHHLYTPYAQADAALRRANVDLVIVEADRAPFAADLVINRPDLTNRPLRLLAQHVDDDLLAAVCKPGVTVAIAPPGLFLPIRDYFAMQAEAPRASEGELARKLIAAGCAVREIAGSP